MAEPAAVQKDLALCEVLSMPARFLTEPLANVLIPFFVGVVEAFQIALFLEDFPLFFLSSGSS